MVFIIYTNNKVIMTDTTKTLTTNFAQIMKHQEYHKIPETLDKLLPDAKYHSIYLIQLFQDFHV